jgi:tRNA pseudouridine38-40 synthase
MQRYFLYLSYDGTAYCGWQNQPNAISVQQRIEESLSLLLRQPVAIVGAGRTDAGVHAKLMVAHFTSPHTGGVEGGALVNKLNGVLPHDIAIQKILPVKPEAHARFSAISREYQYFICFEKDAFRHPFHLRCRHSLDFDKMNEAAALLLEYQDFACFCKLHSDNKTTLCRITNAKWTQHGAEWIFTIRADRFLRNMVRATVGTLLEVGRGKLTVENFRQIITSRQRSLAGTSAPANGLFLTDIEYPPEIFLS